MNVEVCVEPSVRVNSIKASQMRRSDIRAQTASVVRLSQDEQLEISRQYAFWSRLSLILSRLGTR